MPTRALRLLVITAGLMALVLLWSRVRLGPGVPRLAGEVVITMLAISALL